MELMHAAPPRAGRRRGFLMPHGCARRRWCCSGPLWLISELDETSYASPLVLVSPVQLVLVSSAPSGRKRKLSSPRLSPSVTAAVPCSSVVLEGLLSPPRRSHDTSRTSRPPPAPRRLPLIGGADAERNCMSAAAVEAAAAAARAAAAASSCSAVARAGAELGTADGNRASSGTTASAAGGAGAGAGMGAGMGAACVVATVGTSVNRAESPPCWRWWLARWVRRRRRRVVARVSSGGSASNRLGRKKRC